METDDILAPGSWVTVSVLHEAALFDVAHGRVDAVSISGVLVQVVAWVERGTPPKPEPVIFPRGACVFRACALLLGEPPEPPEGVTA